MFQLSIRRIYLFEQSRCSSLNFMKKKKKIKFQHCMHAAIQHIETGNGISFEFSVRSIAIFDFQLLCVALCNIFFHEQKKHDEFFFINNEVSVHIFELEFHVRWKGWFIKLRKSEKKKNSFSNKLSITTRFQRYLNIISIFFFHFLFRNEIINSNSFFSFSQNWDKNSVQKIYINCAITWS